MASIDTEQEAWGEHSAGAQSPLYTCGRPLDVAEADATMPWGSKVRASSSMMRLKLPGTGSLSLARADR